MQLYHGTFKENLPSILATGLKPNGMGIVYLSPDKKVIDLFGGKFDVLLKVETGDTKLTAFDDCKDWEVLCWGAIPPEDIQVLERR